ncbi:MAG: biopolymer transporter ExbD [Acidobacteriia bacterium]|nr:biopolymer transporter ExbD [Terriglobia bacterium]
MTGRIGIILLVLAAGSHIGWKIWYETRTWVPLDISISLSPGHIKTNEFKINLESSYDILLEVERRFDFEQLPCMLGLLNCKDTPSILRANWTLSRAGQVVARGSGDKGEGKLRGSETMGRLLGAFWAGKGEHYVLDIDVLGDGSRLNAGHPRLEIVEGGGAYQEYERSRVPTFYELFFFIFGAAWLIHSLVNQATERRQTKAYEAIATTPHAAITYREVAEFRGRGRLRMTLWGESTFQRSVFPRKRLFAKFHTFGLVFALTYFVAAISFMAVICWQEWRPTGFMVHLLSQNDRVGMIHPWTQALVLRIDSHNHWFLNSKQISPADLGRALKELSSRSMNPAVFVDADSNGKYENVVQAVDLIEGAGGKTVLYTPASQPNAR